MDYESSRSVYAQNGSANRRSSQETQPSQTEVPTWEEKPRSLKDLVIRGKYPCIVKVSSSVVKKYMGHTTGGDGTHGVAEEVLHVIELRRHKMVVGTKLHWERMTSDYTRTDKHFQINVAQKGWFEVLPENGQPVEYFDTIHAIVGLRCKQFLVRTSLVGYQLSSENGVSSWVPLEIRPGEILTTGIIHMDQKKTKKKTLFRRLFSWSNNSDKKEKELKYLQCFDSEHREIMVPLIMTGVFSPVGEPTSTNYDAVYSLHDLISAFNLPLKVQLIHTDAHSAGAIPSGVVLLERLQDNDSVLVSTHPYDENVTPTFEIPLNDDIQVFKEKIKKSKTQSIVSNSNVALIENGDDVVDNIQINLPIRIKEPKKSKGITILDKLSVRSKSRKERASLKALQEEGVFSSRLSKTDLTFDDLCKNAEDETAEAENNFQTPHVADETDPYKTKKQIDIENGYSENTRRQTSTVQGRDLPPLPSKTRGSGNRHYQSKENDYEELPVAPGPPQPSHFYLGNNTDGDADGYMTPARFKELNEANKGDYDNVVKRKPPTAPKPDYARISRARKARSEYSPSESYQFDQDSVDIVGQHVSSATSNGYSRVPVMTSPYDRRSSPAGIPYQEDLTRTFTPDNRRFHDDLDMVSSKPLSGFMKMKSRSHKNLNVEMNATIRSHNVRKIRNAMDVFSYNDSLRDLRQPFPNGANEQPMEQPYGRVVDNERIKSYLYAQQIPYGRLSGSHYVESEPGFKRYPRQNSNAALSDSFPKYGDDSAISMNSRGEYGVFQGESEYSYSEYAEWHDDGWIPPDDISNLSVLEVSKSLRFIGMKDRVVIRFAREQIDGNMLQTLDHKLLMDGFPELNALDVKKILDFVGGWRPRK